MDPALHSNALQLSDPPTMGVTHLIRCTGDGVATVYLFDAVFGLGYKTADVPNTYLTLTADSTATTPGSPTTTLELVLNAAPAPTVGEYLFIWDITNYRYRSFQVASITGPVMGVYTITTTSDTGLDIAFAINDLVGRTPPFDDVYKMDVSALLDIAANTNFAVGFLDETPLAFANIAALLAEPSLNWAMSFPVEAALNFYERNGILLPRFKPSRYLAIVTEAAVSAGPPVEHIHVMLYRKRLNSIAGALTASAATDI